MCAHILSLEGYIGDNLMKAIVKPEVMLYCQNPECGYSDECWRFRAFGGDDVTYKCPKCDTVADLKAIKAEVLETKVVEKKETNVEELLFIVGDFGKGSLRIMREHTVQEAGLDDADILIPMVDSVDVDALNPRAKTDFLNSLDVLSEAITEGKLPPLQEVQDWLGDIYDSLIGAPAQKEVAIEPQETLSTLDQFQDGFKHGFSAGVTFAMLDMRNYVTPQMQEETAVETAEAPSLPETAPLSPKPKITPQRKRALLKAMRKRGRRR